MLSASRLSLRKKLVFTAFVAAAALAALELVLLRFDAGRGRGQETLSLPPYLTRLGFPPDRYPHRLVAGFRDGRHRINSLGLKGDELTRQPEPGRFRIVVLGGSTVYGHSGPTSVCSWPESLGDALRARRPELRAEVVNGGVESYAMHDVLNRFEDDVLPLAPHLVILSNGWNDMDVTPEASDFGARAVHQAREALEDSALAKRIRQAAHEARQQALALRSSGARERMATRYRDFVPYHFLEPLVRLLDEAARARTPVMLTTLGSFLAGPVREEDFGKLVYLQSATSLDEALDLYETYNRAIEETAAARGIALIDQREVTRAPIFGALMYDQMHSLCGGYRRIGEHAATAVLAALDRHPEWLRPRADAAAPQGAM